MAGGSNGAECGQGGGKGGRGGGALGRVEVEWGEEGEGCGSGERTGEWWVEVVDEGGRPERAVANCCVAR